MTWKILEVVHREKKYFDRAIPYEMQHRKDFFWGGVIVIPFQFLCVIVMATLSFFHFFKTIWTEN